MTHGRTNSSFDKLKNFLGEKRIYTAATRGFGLIKIPLIFAVSPKVQHLDEEQCRLLIPLNFVTKNHLGSMYFGALCIGADLACGLLAKFKFGRDDINFLFKDVQAQFLKRCESDALFICQQGAAIDKALAETRASGERVNTPLDITVLAPDSLGEEPCARFTLTLSLKAY